MFCRYASADLVLCKVHGAQKAVQLNTAIQVNSKGYQVREHTPTELSLTDTMCSATELFVTEGECTCT